MAKLIPCFDSFRCDDISGLCRCNPPYFGETCLGEHFCTEQDGQCHNGGTCNATSGYCECTNDPAVYGEACEMHKDPYVFGCENGGTINRTYSITDCTCPEPFYGRTCALVNTTLEEFLCSTDNDCNGGTCQNDGICDCGNTTQYGTLCERSFDCNLDGCTNFGKCNADSGICECESPYEGHDCSVIPDCTSDEMCHQSAADTYSWCNLVTGTCECYFFGYYGKLCELFPKCYREGFCHNGGHCNALGK